MITEEELRRTAFLAVIRLTDNMVDIQFFRTQPDAVAFARQVKQYNNVQDVEIGHITLPPGPDYAHVDPVAYLKLNFGNFIRNRNT